VQTPESFRIKKGKEGERLTKRRIRR